MKVWVRTTIFAATAAVMAAAVSAPPKAESRLAGVKLYDSGVDVARRFGSPTDVFPVMWGGNQGGGGGGGMMGGGKGGANAGEPSPMGMRNTGPNAPIDFIVPPLSFRQGLLKGGGAGGGGMAGPQPAGGGGGGGGGVGGSEEAGIQYVRWIYRRGAGSSMNVVLNKFNKVVQIEAIGVANTGVRTSRGITLGSSMASVIKAYQGPDAYEVGGDYIMMRFLRTAKCAFRFTRENATSAYKVTGIVVSAGKA